MSWFHKHLGWWGSNKGSWTIDFTDPNKKDLVDRTDVIIAYYQKHIQKQWELFSHKIALQWPSDL